MKKVFLLVLMILVSANAWAGFGGARAGGFSGSRSTVSSGGYRSSSSSFGGIRSGAATRSGPAPIIRPATPSRSTTYSAPVTTHVREVHHYGSGGGFVNGYLWGSMLNHSQPVVVTPGVAGVAVPGGVAAPVAQSIIVEESHPVAWAIGILLLMVSVIVGVALIRGLDE